MASSENAAYLGKIIEHTTYLCINRKKNNGFVLLNIFIITIWLLRSDNTESSNSCYSNKGSETQYAEEAARVGIFEVLSGKNLAEYREKPILIRYNAIW